MSSDNPFPESPQKAYLRRIHLKDLASLKERLGRGLAYFGLPSAEMRDVKVWRPLLQHITAVERDPLVASYMYRNAMKLGIRDKTVVIENTLSETCRLLAMEDRDIKLSLSQLRQVEQDKLRRVRSITHDVINLDLCGGFLYSGSDNADMLRNLMKFQAVHRSPFYLVVTFHTRDTGGDDYATYITEALDQLEAVRVDTTQVREFYLAEKVEDQPRNLRRLRFCVPAYLQKVTYEDFQVTSRGAWYYKTFYHTALLFEPRTKKGALKLPWPPIDEFRALLNTPMKRIAVSDTDAQEEEITLVDLPAPSLAEVPRVSSE